MPTELDPKGAELRTIHDAVTLRGACVLEVGAGDGRLTFQYAQEVLSVVAIDTEEKEIRTAANPLRTHDLNVRFMCASASALPFRSERFDIVILGSSL